MQAVFNRYEKKYLLNHSQYLWLRERLLPYMETDQYGWHTICNLYYDTPEDQLIRTSLQKPVYKEKLRLRSYGIPNETDKVFLEIKKKYQGIVNKRRIAIPLGEVDSFLKGDLTSRELSWQENQILKEIRYFLRCYPGLYPKVYLAYDRLALSGREDKEFRVTFDTRIRSRYQGVRLEQGDQGELLLEEGMYLMETKINGASPLWFNRLLEEKEIRSVSFSKYGRVYEQHIHTHNQQMQKGKEEWYDQKYII